MNCDEMRPLVGASVDRELSAGDEWRLRQHLADCADCRRAADAVCAIGHAVRGAPYHRAPAALEQRIAAALRAAATPADGGREPPRVASGADEASGARPQRGSRRRRRDVWRLWFGERDTERDTNPDTNRGAGRTGARTRGPAAYGLQQGLPQPRALPAAGWMAAALLVLAALGAGIAVNLRPSADNSAFVDELVASHVRAQLSGRALDVPSSDRHTVKPWFNGRIDYAPPVEDLAADGFPLVGGRLDYVGRERVAVLVYRYRQHAIDVYVFARSAGVAARAPAPPPLADGFALARWQRAGMTWWAVTDAGPDALTAFRAALDARLSGA